METEGVGDLDRHYVLVRSGHRAGQKGTVWKVADDGTVEVAFKLGVGGGYETSYFLPSDLRDLGMVEECKIQQPGHDHLRADCPNGGGDPRGLGDMSERSDASP